MIPLAAFQLILRTNPVHGCLLWLRCSNCRASCTLYKPVLRYRARLKNRRALVREAESPRRTSLALFQDAPYVSFSVENGENLKGLVSGRQTTV
jgi:hypothetical protein